MKAVIKRKLTERQKEILNLIITKTEEYSKPPTYAELAKILGITVPSLYVQVKTLTLKGYVGRTGDTARNLIVLKNANGKPITLTARYKIVK